MEVLSSRILLRPADLDRSRRFYRDVLGLAIYREFGSPDDPGVVFFLGPGLLEVSGRAAGPAGGSLMIWLQVRDVHAEHERLAAAGVRVLREPMTEPWGLIEMWIEDPEGVRIVLVEIPVDHPLRRDPRSLPRQCTVSRILTAGRVGCRDRLLPAGPFGRILDRSAGVCPGRAAAASVVLAGRVVTRSGWSRLRRRARSGSSCSAGRPGPGRVPRPAPRSPRCHCPAGRCWW